MKLRTLLIAAFAASALHAQEAPADPFRAAEKGEAVDPDYSGPANVSICYEVFSVPLAEAAGLQRKRLSDPALYRLLTESVEKESARQESFVIVRARSGEKATGVGITENIYPTEFEPPKTPNSVSVSLAPPAPGTATAANPEPANPAATPAELPELRVPATPTSFETRNCGTTVEIAPNLGENLNIVDLIIAPEHVTLVGQAENGHEFSITRMPIFESQRINTAASLYVDRPYLLGTVNRPPDSKVDPDSANRVWFAFVTATVASL